MKFTFLLPIVLISGLAVGAWTHQTDKLASTPQTVPGLLAALNLTDDQKAGFQAQERKKQRPSGNNQPKPEVNLPIIKVPVTPVVGPPPASRFNLKNWKLTLPYNKAGNYGGHAAEIGAKQLVAGFKDPHFYTDANGTMIFWCPVIGSTTGNTKFPRSELREMLEPGNVGRNWDSTGTHQLEGRCRLLQVPSYPKVVIGQIHSYTGKSKPLVKLQYYKGRMEALVKLSPFAGKDKLIKFADVGLNNDIAWQIQLKDAVLSVTVNGVTQTENMLTHDPRWAEQTFYFKAGAYPQDDTGDVTEGARVAFSQLNASHNQKP
ncbi:MAG: polysaccharide lyase family 7 protein [Verrucomicrobia subdivision 3 bacterium]|nr:polysaccharide lyase family 7 protein [Limisphaerales bacterium]